MKKQILIISLIGLMTLNISALIAQNQRGGGPQREEVAVLTDAQTKTVNNILLKYDSESLSADDANAIMKAMREAKIPNGKGLEKAISNAGFSFEKIRKLAPPPPRPDKNNESKKR